MDPNYAMAKFGLESKAILKSKHRGCWYYTKYFFFFLSIIQFLIILGLVLFMLYGNAHVGTEDRLKRVETRFNDLLAKYNLLNMNYSQMKPKVASLEKENLNCSYLLGRALNELKNRTCGIGRHIIPSSTTEPCKGYQIAMDRLNTTCIIETLQIKHQILYLQRDYDRLKEKCEQTSATLANQFNATTSEVEKLQEGKKALETQIKLLQNACSNINDRFQAELEYMKNRFEGIISSHESSQYSRCWTISNEIKNNVDKSIDRLKQDVNNVMFENSQLKTDKERMIDNFQKCSQEKVAVISEKNYLSTEKVGLEKQLFEKKEELAKSYSRFMKKEEELETCRKMQSVGRVPHVPFPRT